MDKEKKVISWTSEIFFRDEWGIADTQMAHVDEEGSETLNSKLDSDYMWI